MGAPRVVVVGAGMGGLAAAADLAREGAEVTVLERAAGPGGKMRAIDVGGFQIDAGPTVFTMRWVFDGLFGDAGERLDDHLALTPADLLARHGWRDGSRLDLFADVERSAQAIAEFAGAREADGFRRFVRRSADVHATLCDSFMRAQKPASPLELVARLGLGGLPGLYRTAPMSTLWQALGEFFRDPRLRQLFARYATYVGSSPLAAPATLMLIAHVEQAGVWVVRGGMRRVACALEALGRRQGAQYCYGAHVEQIVTAGDGVRGVQLADGERLDADAVVFNGDSAALAAGLLGSGVRGAVGPTSREQRSLSAVTWCVAATARGFPLSHHNVFFAEDYPREFQAIFRDRRITEQPTVYVCAQARGAGAGEPPTAGAREPLLLLVNAPADGDRPPPAHAAWLADVRERAFVLLEDCGLQIDGEAVDGGVVTAPAQFHDLFPGTGGALYGRANHGPWASFQRPGAALDVPGLYLAGGSAHPGAGVPMTTLSGRLAAERVLADFAASGRRRAGTR